MPGPDTTRPEPLEALRPRRETTERRRPSARLAMHRPSRRAIVGGLLVAIAVLFAWVAVDAGERRPGREIVVATRAIAPGERIDASALEVRTVTMDDGLASRDFSSTGQLVDAVALGPIAEGDPVPRSAVLQAANGGNLRQFSFPVDRDRSLNGDLRPGERVDVMATFGSGSDSTTTVIARDALVLRVGDQKSGSIGSTAKLILTIGLTSADQVLDAVHASQVADLTVVRSTLAADGSTGRSSTTGPTARSAAVRP